MKYNNNYEKNKKRLQRLEYQQGQDEYLEMSVKV